MTRSSLFVLLVACLLSPMIGCKKKSTPRRSTRPVPVRPVAGPIKVVSKKAYSRVMGMKAYRGTRWGMSRKRVRALIKPVDVRSGYASFSCKEQLGGETIKMRFHFERGHLSKISGYYPPKGTVKAFLPLYKKVIKQLRHWHGKPVINRYIKKTKSHLGWWDIPGAMLITRLKLDQKSKKAHLTLQYSPIKGKKGKFKGTASFNLNREVIENVKAKSRPWFYYAHIKMSGKNKSGQDFKLKLTLPALKGGKFKARKEWKLPKLSLKMGGKKYSLYDNWKQNFLKVGISEKKDSTGQEVLSGIFSARLSSGKGADMLNIKNGKFTLKKKARH